MKKAVIFDMNGVIPDTQKFHAAAESAVLRRYGTAVLPQTIIRKYARVPDDVMCEEIFAQYDVSIASIGKLLLEKWNLVCGGSGKA